MDIFQAIFLGLVQGFTEFLPVSSSAHLVFIPWAFGWENQSLEFDVALHMGTLLAVLVYFAPNWKQLIGGFFRSIRDRSIGDDTDKRLSWLIILASVPAALIGVIAEGVIDDYFHEPGNLRIGLLVIAIMMMVMGALLWMAERAGRRVYDLKHVDLKMALTVGFAQALALVPGVSRSGSTITAGLFLGLKREAAARFSFLLSTPVVLGAGLKKLYDVVKEGGIPADEQVAFAAGFIASAGSGFLCIFFLMRYLQRRSTLPFVAYRFLIGIGLLLLLLLGFRA